MHFEPYISYRLVDS